MSCFFKLVYPKKGEDDDFQCAMRLRTTIFDPVRGKLPVKVELPAPREIRDTPASRSACIRANRYSKN